MITIFYFIICMSICFSQSLFSMAISRAGKKESPSSRKRGLESTSPAAQKKVKREEEVADFLAELEKSENKIKFQAVLSENKASSQPRRIGQKNYTPKKKITGNGETLLHLATKYDRVDLVCKLLNANAKTKNKPDRQQHTPLHLAVIAGDEELVDIILKNLVELNAKNCFGMTALHLAALHNRVSIAKKLIKAGASVNCKQKGELQTALHIAARQGNAEMVVLLLEKRAKAGKIDQAGQTPFEVAKNDEIREIIKNALMQKKKN